MVFVRGTFSSYLGQACCVRPWRWRHAERDLVMPSPLHAECVELEAAEASTSHEIRSWAWEDD